MKRACIGCGVLIEACMGFGLARDVLAIEDGLRAEPVRELCGRCVFRAETDPHWFEQIAGEAP